VTLATLLEPGWLVFLLVWCFAVLAAAQLTIRLIMAFSVRQTFVGAVVLSCLALPIAAVYDLAVGPDPSLALRLTRAPVPMLLMAAAGFATSRWVLRIKRLRGQIIAALMVGLLDVHLFTFLTTL
jgi:hypothetical protein